MTVLASRDLPERPSIDLPGTGNEGRTIAAYCRISQDKRGNRQGVQAQWLRLEEFGAETWPGGRLVLYEDDNLSGFDAIRPDFERLLVDSRLGLVHAVTAVEESRLSRRFGRMDELTDALLAGGHKPAEIWAEDGERIDVTRTDWNPYRHRKRELANEEYVWESKRRTTRAVRAYRKQGRPHGGSVFGYRHERNEDKEATLVVELVEAEAIRDMAVMALAGRTLTDIARAMEARGLKTSTGRDEWTNETVKRLLTIPRTAGFRIDNDGREWPGNWAAILDRDTYDRLVALFGAPTREARTSKGGRTLPNRHAPHRKYLLTGGIAICDYCGAELVSNARKMKGGTVRAPYYDCSKKRNGCGRLTVPGVELEERVTADVMKLLRRPAVIDILSTDETADERAAVTADIDATQARFDLWCENLGADVSADVMARKRDAHRADMAKKRAKLDSLRPTGDPYLAYDQVPARWESLSPLQRRAVVAAFGFKVRARRVAHNRKLTEGGAIAIAYEWPDGRNRLTMNHPGEPDRNLEVWRKACEEAGMMLRSGNLPPDWERPERPPLAGEVLDVMVSEAGDVGRTFAERLGEEAAGHVVNLAIAMADQPDED